MKRSVRPAVAEVFNDYAKYYDLLYKDKDYEAEAAYVQALIRRYRPDAKTLLNLGCGTGKHDACLQKLGYKVCGVDLSETMLKEACKRAIPDKLEFFHGDVRSIDLGRKFDAVISLFHVISYQTTESDVLAMLETASNHLKSKGLLIFDFWHGKGVLNDPPSLRVKRLEDDTIKIVRTAVPVTHHDRRLVEVNYQIVATDKKSLRESEIRETHTMQYFFLEGLDKFLSKSGFLVDDSFEWMSDRPLAEAWYGLIVSSKQGKS